MSDKVFFYTPDNDTKIAGLYDLEHTIGRGHYAVVKLARHVFTGEKVAVKVIDKTKLDDIAQDHLFQEVVCMKLVQHPNVVRLYEVIDTPTKLYLILELGDGGDLYDYIMRHGCGLHEKIAKRYFRQIVTAIAYCHKLHVVHRDLKPENVVFFEKLGLVKLTDFGFSNRFTPGMNLDTACGSLAYSAPEILLGDPYDAPKVDIWSLGVILYMLVCGQLPFQEATDSETLTKIMDCDYAIPNYISPECSFLISRLLVRDPEKRAHLDDILQADWLKQDSEDSLPIELFSIPLVSKECLSFEDHMEILSKMSEGQLATVEEIQSTLDRNEYNHIAATYFLLAERKLKRNYIEQYKLLTQQAQTDEWLRQQHLQQQSEISGSLDKGRNYQYNELSGKAVPTSPRVVGSAVPVSSQSGDERIRRFSMILEDEEEEEEERKSSIFTKLGRLLPGTRSNADVTGATLQESRIFQSELKESANMALLEEEEELLTVANLVSVRSDFADQAVLAAVNETREFGPNANFARPCSRTSVSAVEVSDGTESDTSWSNWSTARNSYIGSSLGRSLPPSETRRKSHYRRAVVLHRPLITVKSSPQLLKHITEEETSSKPGGIDKISPFRTDMFENALRHFGSSRRTKHASSEDVSGTHSLRSSFYGHHKLTSPDDQSLGVHSRLSWAGQRALSTTHSPTRTKRLFTSTVSTSRPTSIGSWSAAFNMSLLNEFRRRSVCSSPVENLNGSFVVKRKPLTFSSQSQNQTSLFRNQINDRRCSGPPNLTEPASTFFQSNTIIASPSRSESESSFVNTDNPQFRSRNHSESDNLSSDLPKRSKHTIMPRSSTSVPFLDSLTDSTVFEKSLPNGASAFSITKGSSMMNPDNRSPNRTLPPHQKGTLTRSPNRSFGSAHTSITWSNSTPMLYDHGNFHNCVDLWSLSFPATSLGTVISTNNVPTPVNSCAPTLREGCTPIREEEDELSRAGDVNHIGMQPVDPEFFSRQSSEASDLHTFSSMPTTDSARSNRFTVIQTSASAAQPDRLRPVSRLTASNFSLSSLATYLRDSRHMLDIIRGTFELQCHYNRRTASSFAGGSSSGDFQSGNASTSVSVRSLAAVSERPSITTDLNSDVHEGSYRFTSGRTTLNTDPSAPPKSSACWRRPLSSPRYTRANGPVCINSNSFRNDVCQNSQVEAVTSSTGTMNTSMVFSQSVGSSCSTRTVCHATPRTAFESHHKNGSLNNVKSVKPSDGRIFPTQVVSQFSLRLPESESKRRRQPTSIGLIGFDRNGDLRLLESYRSNDSVTQNVSRNPANHSSVVDHCANTNNNNDNVHLTNLINSNSSLNSNKSPCRSHRTVFVNRFKSKRTCCVIS